MQSMPSIIFSFSMTRMAESHRLCMLMSLCHASNSARCLDASSLLGKFFPADSHCRRDGSWSSPSRFALMILTHLACKPEIQAEILGFGGERREQHVAIYGLQTYLFLCSPTFYLQDSWYRLNKWAKNTPRDI